MPSVEYQIAQLHEAIRVQEGLRPALGNRGVDVVIASLHTQIDELRHSSTAHPLENQLEQLSAAELILVLQSSPELVYSFKHALTQDAAYRSLLIKDRTAIHNRVAQCYERLFAEHLDELAPILAYHYARGGDDAHALEYSLKAAVAAARRFAYAEAALHYRGALAAFLGLPDVEDNRRRRVDTIAQYVEIAWGASDPAHQLDLLADAETLARSLPGRAGTAGDPLRLARIHTMMAAMHLARNEYREVVRLAQDVLDDAKVLDDPSLLLTPSAQLGAVMVLQGRFAAAVPYLHQAIQLLAEDIDRWEWAWCYGFLAISLAMRGQVSAGLVEAQHALTRMEATHNTVGVSGILVFRLAVYLELGDMPQLLAESQQAIVLALQTDAPLYQSIGLDYQALALSRLGQHAEAEQRMAEARVSAARVGGQFMMSDWLAAAHAEIAFNAGRFQDALTLAAEAVASAQTKDGAFAQGWAHRIWGQSLAALDPERGTEAATHLGESLRLLTGCDARLEAAYTKLVGDGLRLA